LANASKKNKHGGNKEKGRYSSDIFIDYLVAPLIWFLRLVKLTSTELISTSVN